MAGNLFIISAPSGTGKTTVIRRLLETVSDLTLSISYTTRDPRPHERNGVDYAFIEEKLSGGRDLLLDIDVQGAAKVKQRYPNAILIFLMPPSFDDLKERIRSRGTDDEASLKKRLADAGEEFSRRHEYDYQVVNDDLEEAVGEVAEIISYYRGG